MAAEKEKKPREYRGVQDEIHEQHLKLKDMTWKERFGYYWHYYKFHTLAVILIGGFLFSLIHDIVSAKDYGFYGILLNATVLSNEKMQDSFAEYADIDTEEYDCYIDADSSISHTQMTEFDMATSQRLIALIQTGDLDAAVFDSIIFNNYANNEVFLDLRTVLSKEEQEKYQDYFYYVDYGPIERADADSDYVNENLISDESRVSASLENMQEEAETHRHPENMEKPVPVGIFMEECPFVATTGNYSELIPIFGFPATTTRIEVSRKYLEFLWDDSIDFVSMLTN